MNSVQSTKVSTRALLILACLATVLVASTTRALPQAAVSLTGVVMMHEGGDLVPASHIALYVTGASGKIGPSYSDTNGRFAFVNLSPGDYILTCVYGGEPVWESHVQVPAQIRSPIVIAP
jgi:hypothetical protein